MIRLRYISLFSGIEAASVAWEPLGWEPVAFSEIEPFPCAVLAERFPDVPNLGDVNEIDWSDYVGAVDLIVGGSPCQAFSVAGRRRGLMDERGRLMLEYVRAVREIRPRWVLWENVPGVLPKTKARPSQRCKTSWSVAGIRWHGECLTLNSSEWPKDAAVCSLSDILIPDAPQRYFLSARACAGILRRAEIRGKSLPPQLDAVLRAAASGS